MVNPADRTLERQPQAEPLTYERAPEESERKPENDSFVQTSLLTGVQVEEQSSNEIRLRENDQILTTEGNTIFESLIDQPPVGQLQTVDSNSIGWQKLGIGILTGIIVSGIILACTSRMHIFNNLGRLALLIWEVLCAIIGALTANFSKKNWRDVWVGAIQWSLVPVWIALVIISLIYLLMFTSLFGV